MYSYNICDFDYVEVWNWSQIICVTLTFTWCVANSTEKVKGFSDEGGYNEKKASSRNYTVKSQRERVCVCVYCSGKVQSGNLLIGNYGTESWKKGRKKKRYEYRGKDEDSKEMCFESGIASESKDFDFTKDWEIKWNYCRCITESIFRLIELSFL